MNNTFLLFYTLRGWGPSMTVRNGITGITRMTGMNWMARISGMTVMNGITVVTRMTES